jgi:RNA polymerase sigma factor (sigma-70 family)
LEVLQTREGREELFSGLASLNEMERKVVIAHELEGVPFAEMAELWNIPQNTLLSHKSRAMRKLKIYFRDS